MLRRRCPLHYEHLLLSDSETESDDLSKYCNTQTRKINEKRKIIATKCHKSKRNKRKIGIREESSRDAKSYKEDPETVIKLAKEYQQKMKQIPIPKTRRSTKDIVFITWHALTSSMKQAYGQPLHYLTRVLAKQWDRSRNGTDEGQEIKPMDDIIPPAKAESIIWDVEEIHRLCTSYSYLAKLWVSDPDYHAFIDEVLVTPTS